MAWRCHGADNFELLRNLKINQIITSPEVYNAMRTVDRQYYVSQAPYRDEPQAIGYGATISAPHMHAYALELLKEHLKNGERALDVGSGSGYLTACMAFMVGENGKAVGVDHVHELIEIAQANIKKGNPELLKRIILERGDGRFGAKNYAPYNAIHVGAASPEIPKALIDQLKPGGRLVVPVGPPKDTQTLTVVDKNLEGVTSFVKLMDVVYVPLTDEKTQWTK
ncbi:protein-L-isoaspartate(D-aspartate) O-methyltransferase isoform X2 [Adelges cooleyi]|nr:protein-L-isoaspartate(D-aspartate) O-methyltransferase isoform X2 [Adelges cooleyi]